LLAKQEKKYNEKKLMDPAAAEEIKSNKASAITDDDNFFWICHKTDIITKNSMPKTPSRDF
jgi:hypothetical protein